MTPEWVAAIVAIAAAIIAAASAAVARSQAVSAKRQADSSEKAAEAAEIQAREAGRASEAAENAHRLEELKIYQAAQKAIRHLNSGAQAAIEQAQDGQEDTAELNANHMINQANELRYMPLVLGLQHREVLDGLLATASLLHRHLEQSQFDLGGKTAIYSAAQGCASLILAQTNHLSAAVLAEINARRWRD